MLGRIEGRRRTTDGWMVSRLNGHEFEQAPGDGDGQGSLVCCSPWGCKESDTTEQLNNNKIKNPNIPLFITFLFHLKCICSFEGDISWTR